MEKRIDKEGKELLDRMRNLVVENTRKTIHQIIFNPTSEQRKNFWCDNCDGFHKTENCREKTKTFRQNKNSPSLVEHA